MPLSLIFFYITIISLLFNCFNIILYQYCITFVSYLSYSSELSRISIGISLFMMLVLLYPFTISSDIFNSAAIILYLILSKYLFSIKYLSSFNKLSNAASMFSTPISLSLILDLSLWIFSALLITSFSTSELNLLVEPVFSSYPIAPVPL